MSSSNCNKPFPEYLTFRVPLPSPARIIFDDLWTLGTNPPKKHWLMEETVRSHLPLSHHNSNRCTPSESLPSSICRKDISIWISGIFACAQAVPFHINPNHTIISAFFIALSFDNLSYRVHQLYNTPSVLGYTGHSLPNKSIAWG